MNTASQVDVLLAGWKEKGLERADILWRLADACLGWSYVFGARGQECTPSVRRSYARNYSSSKPAEAKAILNKCQVCRETNPKETCVGCTFYPNGKTRCYDCRGFTAWCLGKMGIELKGAGATSQWNDSSNWSLKGEIKDLPKGQIACFFHQNPNDHKTMEHTGFILDNTTIHCSGTVKRESPSKKITHFAVPKGLEGGVVPVTKPTLRRGSKGEWVTVLQTKLIQLGYSLPRYGADGSFGAETETAVKTFQKDRGLKVDGIVGSATWDALESGTVELFTVKVEHLGKSVAEEIVKLYGGTITKEGA